MVKLIKDFCDKNQTPYCSVNVKYDANGKKDKYFPTAGWKHWTPEQSTYTAGDNCLLININGNNGNQYVVIDADTEEALEKTFELLKKFGIYSKKYLKKYTTNSVSNILNGKSNKYHFWFKSKGGFPQHINIDGIGLDLITKHICEHIDTTLGNFDDMPEFTYPMYYFLRPNDDLEKGHIEGDNNNDDNYENEFTEEAIEDLIDLLDTSRSDEYESWRNIGMILKGMDEDYISIWDKFSRRSKKYSGYKSIVQAWKGFKGPDNQPINALTIGSIISMALEDSKIKAKQWLKTHTNYEQEEKKKAEIKAQEKAEAKAKKQQEAQEEKAKKSQEKAQANKTASEQIEEKYKEKKTQVEKTFFKCLSPMCYIEEDKEGLIFRNKADTTEYFRNHNLKANYTDYNGNEKELKKNFFQLWAEDENIRTYKNIIFDPSNKCPQSSYNEFKGFEYDSEIICNELPEEFAKMFNFIFSNDTSYIYSWMSHIINKPHLKTNVAIVLYSKLHGVGKNTICELFMKLLKKYTAKLEVIDDLTKNFNANLCNKLFIYGDEIKPKAKELADELKNIITRTTVNYEKKYFDSKTINDYANYFFTTNNELAFNIEVSDRRYYFIEAPETKLNDEDYTNFYRALEDDAKLIQAFSFFKNLANPVNLKDITKTTYKQRIIAQKIPAYFHMLFTSPYKFIGKTFTSIELFNESKKYAQETKMATSYTVTRFGIDIKEVGIPKSKKSSNFFVFPKTLDEYKQMMRTYNENYYINLGLDLIEEIDEEEEANPLDV